MRERIAFFFVFQGKGEREPFDTTENLPILSGRSEVVSLGLNSCPISPPAVRTRPNQLPSASFMIISEHCSTFPFPSVGIVQKFGTGVAFL